MFITEMEAVVDKEVKAYLEAFGTYFKDLRIKFALETAQVAVFLDIPEEEVLLFEEGKKMLSLKAIATLSRSYSQTLREVLLTISLQLH